MNTTKTYTYKKFGVDRYEVLRDGVSIGFIDKGWSRLGGEGWQCKAGGKSHKNRDAAARDLWNRVK